jgi:hypothetical protein
VKNASPSRAYPAAGLVRVSPSLVAGDEVFALLTEKCGAVRELLVGVARCTVIDVAGELVTVDVIASNPTYCVGRRLVRTRPTLYLVSDRAEHAAFGRLLKKFWGTNRADHGDRSAA